jgi:adenylosuccinate synthase
VFADDDDDCAVGAGVVVDVAELHALIAEMTTSTITSINLRLLILIPSLVVSVGLDRTTV